MNKITNIIKVLNLFHSRRCVKLKDIMAVCNVCRRTAYRYINTLCAANVLIRYDERTGGYLIDDQEALQINDFGIDDTVITLVALKSLSMRLNSDYSRMTNALLERVFSHLSTPMEHLWKTLEKRTKVYIESDNLSDLVTTLLIHAAISNRRGLRVTSMNTSNSKIEREIENPVLRFRGNWQLHENLSEGNVILIPEIKVVSVL